MITHVIPTSPWLVSSGGAGGPYISPSYTTDTQTARVYAAGDLRYTGNSMQVYDGYNWITMSDSVSVGMTPDAERTLAWAQKKMQEEQALEELCKQHPGIRDLKEKLDMMVALVKKETTNEMA